MAQIVLEPTWLAGLVKLHHHLVTDQLELNRQRIHEIAGASARLRLLLATSGDHGHRKQETPDPARSEASTDRNSSRGSHGGRSPERKA